MKTIIGHILWIIPIIMLSTVIIKNGGMITFYAAWWLIFQCYLFIGGIALVIHLLKPPGDR